MKTIYWVSMAIAAVFGFVCLIIGLRYKNFKQCEQIIDRTRYNMGVGAI